MTNPESGRPVRVWDRPTRVFHWVLVVLFIVCYVSGDRGRFDIHIVAGQALLILVVARIIWGFVGSDTARFRHFLRPPGEAMAHVRTLGERRPGHDVGHNPLGGLSVVAMLLRSRHPHGIRALCGGCRRVERRDRCRMS